MTVGLKSIIVKLLAGDNDWEETTMKVKWITLIALLALSVTSLAGLPSLTHGVRAATDLPVYADTLATGWQDWPYNSATRNYANASPVHAGSASIAVTYTGGWSGLQIGYHGENLDVSAYDTFRFWIHGGSTGGQTIVLQINDAIEQGITPQANTWTQVDVSLLPMGSPRAVYNIVWFNNTGGSQPTFYLDDVAFVDSGTVVPPPPPSIGPCDTKS